MSLTLGARVGLVFATVVATMIAVMAIMVTNFVDDKAAEIRIYQELMPSAAAVRRMRNAADAMFTDEFVFLRDADDTALPAVIFEQQRQQFQDALKEAQALKNSQPQQVLLDAIARDLANFLASDAQLRALARQGRMAEARAVHAHWSEPIRRLRTRLSDMYDLDMSQAKQLHVQSLQSTEAGIAAALGVAAAGILLAAWLWRRTTLDLVQPLQRLRDGAQRVAEGAPPAAGHPRALHTTELAELQAAFDRMAERLQESRARLVEANAGLEAQVAARTADLQRAVGELQALDELKSDFLAAMSHELLTPINFITGFGSALEDGLLGPVTDEQKDALGKMLAGAGRLTRMVRNTLEYTQLQAGRIVLRPREVDWRELVDGTATALGEELARRGQTLTLEVPPDLPTVWADPDRAWQVLYELVDNAAKFSPDGSTIALAVVVAGDGVATTVTDPGVGIPPDALAHMFKPFFQANQTRTREHGGMGLGLALAYHLVVKMGGTLMIGPRPSGGTCVRFTLPHCGEVPAHGPRDDGASRSQSG